MFILFTNFEIGFIYIFYFILWSMAKYTTKDKHCNNIVCRCIFVINKIILPKLYFTWENHFSEIYHLGKIKKNYKWSRINSSNPPACGERKCICTQFYLYHQSVYISFKIATTRLSSVYENHYTKYTQFHEIIIQIVFLFIYFRFSIII